MTSKTTPIIIDCDPGTDDAIALLMACASKKLSILGVTTVGGNQTLNKTTLNALKILSFIQRQDIPVARGCAKPLLRALHTAGEVHGSSGLGGVILPDPVFDVQKDNAVQFIYKTLKHHKRVTLVCIAPLTNIALLLSSHPEIKENIEKIVLMGGGLSHGNCTTTAEFNIYVDPEAAEIVFSAGIPIVMCGLDMTETAIITMEQIEEISHLKGPVARFASDIFEFYSEYYKKMGFPGIAMHDPTTIAYLLHPEMFTVEPLYVQVETQGKYTDGMTIADRRKCADKPAPNALVCTGINVPSFVQLVKDCITSYETGALV